jgi:hypothetical protein
MRALVGGESEWAYGSGPPGGVPNLMKKVGANLQGKHRYIAGHLLNDNMGGGGTNDNLTVLSSNANKRHTGIEGKVKTLAKQADLINRGSRTFGDPAHDHGVRYRVEVLAPAPGANPPYSAQEKYIGRGLEIDIKPIRIHKVTGVESTWPEAAAATLTDHVVPNVPPYPPVAAKKKLTPMQRHIVKAIVAFGATGASFKEITKYLAANVNPIPTRRGVALALKRGVSTKFFSSRAGAYKVIAKNVL